MEKNDLSATPPVAKDVSETKAYQLIEALKKVRETTPFNENKKSASFNKNNLAVLDEAIHYFKSITTFFELSQIKTLEQHIPISEAIRVRKALLDHPKLQLLINEGLLTPISIDVPALKRLLDGKNYTEIHAYPVLNTNADGKNHISQCLIGFEAGKEDFENIEDVFDPWPPTSPTSGRPAQDTLDAEIAKHPLEKGKRAPTV